MRVSLIRVVPWIACVAWSTCPAEPAPGPDVNQHEWPAAPAPAWVKGTLDHGAAPDSDPRLKGIITPAGFKLELVASEPQVIDPIGLTFGDDGTPYVLEWKKTPQVSGVDYEITYKDGTKRTLHKYEKRGGSIAGRPDSADWLKALRDTDGDGKYDKADIIIDDLQIPSSCLIHEGWFYFTSQGRVIRRRQSEPGGKFDVTEEIVRGLCGFNQHQASGLTMSHDGWLYITAGDDDAHAQGSDGSRVDLLRTGGVFRCRPDGSKLQLFARGFRNPYRDVVFDPFQNMFHMDNDNEDGSKWQGCRLIHVQEEADYGWRLHAGVRCCWPDMDRSAVSGERGGKMPVMLKTGRGAPAGLLNYNGTAFPKEFRGWLIYPDVFRRSVRAYRVERPAGSSTFRVVEQFDLMTSDDGYFRPCQAVQGPDGAIYIVDWRTNSAGPGWFWGEQKFGRIYRLTWSGTADLPAIIPGPMDAWARVGAMTNVQLWQELNSEDTLYRQRVVNELVRRGEQHRETFVAVANDEKRPAAARAAALGAACRLSTPRQITDVALDLLGDPHVELRRLAAEALSRQADTAQAATLIPLLSNAWRREGEPAAARAIVLAIGAVGVSATGPRAAEARELAVLLLVAGLVDHFPPRDPAGYDAIVRAIERMGQPAIDAVAATVATSPEMDGEITFRALLTMRSPLAAKAFDHVLQNGRFLGDERLTQLFEAYRHIQSDPPVDMTVVGEWLLKNPDAAEKVQLAALTALGLVGEGNAQRVLPVIEKMIGHPNPRTRLAAMQIVGQQQLLAAAPLLAKAMLDDKRAIEERRAALRALGNLRASSRFATIKQEKGVELVLDEVAALIADGSVGDLRGEALALLARVDLKRAEPLAMRLLNSGEPVQVQAAIHALSADPQQARLIGRLFIDGKLDRALLPQVAATLQKHASQDKTGELQKLLADVYKGGLLVATDAESLKSLEQMVKAKGDPLRGKAVFLDAQRSQCAVCHTLEGVGGRAGPIGPDLTKVGAAMNVAKLIESIIEPSKEIKEGFGTWILTTEEGQVYTGLKVGDTEKAVTIRDAASGAQGVDILVPRGQIKELRAGQKSVMPDNVTSQLSFEELIDLIAFLKDEPAQASLRGLLARAWVVGPFQGDVTAADEPEKSPDPLKPVQGDPSEPGRPRPRPRQWQRLDCQSDGQFDLKQSFAAQGDGAPGGGAAYVLAYLYSPRDQEITLRLNVDGAVKLLVNDAVLYRCNAKARDEKAVIKVKQGWSTLLARVVAAENRTFRFGLQVIAGEGVRLAEKAE